MPDREAHAERGERAAREVRAPLDERDAEAGERARTPGPTTIAPTIRIGWSSRMPTAAICIASTMNATKLIDSSVFSLVRCSTSSQTTASEGRPGAAFSAAVGRVRDRGVHVLDRDRADLRDLQLLEVADDHARVLARDVAEDHVAVGLVGGAVQVHDVEDRRRALEDLERLMRHLLGRDDPQVDHRREATCKGSCRKSALPSDRRRTFSNACSPGSESRSAPRSTSSSSSRRLASTAWRPMYPAPRAPSPTLLARHRSWEAQVTLDLRAAVRRTVAGGPTGRSCRSRPPRPGGCADRHALPRARRQAPDGPRAALPRRLARRRRRRPRAALRSASSDFSQRIGSWFLPSVEPSSSTKRRNRSRSGSGRSSRSKAWSSTRPRRRSFRQRLYGRSCSSIVASRRSSAV